MAEQHVGCRYANAEVTFVVCVDGCGVAGPTMIDEIESWEFCERCTVDGVIMVVEVVVNEIKVNVVVVEKEEIVVAEEEDVVAVEVVKLDVAVDVVLFLKINDDILGIKKIH
ncbi:hypothetical protein L3X38_007103 [Prunus dulcis]|uniref:Uncharacterized protein n=1 Tax=Prunus dulcis TaxID=3755 RepID=A0AAD4ZTY3_PRUDU|nr:hypothetical protein L3X38_007103 [Prunus dulcis]